ncbi:MAG TPA: transposase family protein [Roseiflexaceae bacterium]|nr:transposase family protein [Roseiflexaceae bacterium]
MILRYTYLRLHPAIFKALTGLYLHEFDELLLDVQPRLAVSDIKRRNRPNRKRAPGAGHPFDLPDRDQVLLTVVWLRRYPTHEVLAYLFGVGEWTASRAIKRVLPILEQSGRDTMRMPDPGKKRRRQLDELLANTPELIVLIDTFEQRVQRHRDRQTADEHYSGKKKQHTLKSQVTINEETGEICDIADSVVGPQSDIKTLEESGVFERLPEGVGAGGDLAYVGIAQLHPEGLGVTPRRKPRGKDRPPEDIAFNQAFSKRRIKVEHTIGRMRRYEALSQMDRDHRNHHSARVRAVAGLVNRQLRRYLIA